MTVSIHKASEALYLIIVKHSNAETLLREWVHKHKVQHVSIVGDRLSVFSSHALDIFKLTWPHNFERVTVWDTWRKCHVYLE